MGQGPRYRFDDINVDAFDRRTPEHRAALYGVPEINRTDAFRENSLPMFLSDDTDRPHPSEFITPRRKRRRVYLSSLALMATCGAAALAALYALANSDTARVSLAKLDATTAGLFPAPSVAAQLDRTQPTAVDRQSDVAPPFKFEDRVPGASSLKMAAASPSRDAIKAAYHSALQESVPAPVAPVVTAVAPVATAVAPVPTAVAPVVTAVAPVPTTVAPPEPTVPAEPIRHLDPNDVAASLTRANALIASGDVAAARLVLRHPAEFGDARAAMALAETYDPAFLEKLGVRGFVPNVAMARDWYEKAKKFGAADAARRLEVLAIR